jgi:hypothetical protein
MSDHFIALNRGVEGFKQNDFITGTASTAGTKTMEFRVADGASLTKKDVINALKAFEHFFSNAQWVAPTGIDVKL